MQDVFLVDTQYTKNYCRRLAETTATRDSYTSTHVRRLDFNPASPGKPLAASSHGYETPACVRVRWR